LLKTEEEFFYKYKNTIMQYYFSKTINASFDDAIQKVTEALKADGFGILTEN